MKNKLYKTGLLTIANVLVAYILIPVNLYAQDGLNNDSISTEKKQYRTALLMKQSIHLNQKIDNFFEKPNPKTATYLALVPGLGQIYNKKYWKLPIVYGGFAVTGYFALSNRDYYLQYNEAYKCKVDDPDECEDPLAQKYSAEDLQTIRDYYRRNMELSFIFMAVWYVLQMLDATVDAHLYYWEIDESTTLSIHPLIQPATLTGNKTMTNSGHYGTPAFNGLTVSLKF